MSETQHLASPAQLCQQYQRPYFDVLETLRAQEIRPVLTLDLVPFFDWNTASRALEGKPLPMIQGADHAD